MDYAAVEAPLRSRAERVAEEPALEWTTDKLRGEIAKMRDDMLHAATEMRFEEAAKLRDRLKDLELIELTR